MAEYYFIKPAKGIKLYNPESRDFINADGQRVKKSSYWTRRIAEGSAIEINQAKPAPAGPKREAAAPAAPAPEKKPAGDTAGEPGGAQGPEAADVSKKEPAAGPSKKKKSKKIKK